CFKIARAALSMKLREKDGGGVKLQTVKLNGLRNIEKNECKIDDFGGEQSQEANARKNSRYYYGVWCLFINAWLVEQRTKDAAQK
ncbi:hypothetical protein Tco_1094972, partial [Tanacetum coccineum]